jgi:competence protein ComEA
MEWHEVVARARARLDAAPARVRMRAVASVLLVVVLAVAVLAFVAARSGSAASPPGAAGATGSSAPSTGASSAEAPSATVASSTLATVAATAPVVVSVAGAVVRPGVVTLPFGARVVDAIAAVGGTRGDADPNALDLAAKLVDGVRVYVPKVGEQVSPMPAGGANGSTGGAGATGGTGDAAPSGPVDLNTASETELEALPGIGPSLAQAIITTRTRLGGFRSVDELREVRGIGDRRFSDLQPLVTI